MASNWFPAQGGYSERGAGPLNERAASRRGATLALVIAIHAAILLLLLRMAPETRPSPPDEPAPLVVEMLPGPNIAPDPVTTTPETKRAASGSAVRPAAPPAAAAPPTPPPPVETDPSADIWKRIIPISGADFAAADVKRSGAATVAGDGAPGSGVGDDTETADASGGGAGGERLYDAEWYRKPSRAELSTYFARGTPPGWGMIACRTIADYRVEDCREIGQSAPGLARAVRQAAWQFRVLPPRIGGRKVIGAWVRIRIDYTQEPAAR